MPEREFIDLTPVRHKKDGYTGWIDGTTKMKEIFTGNHNSDWQYRICVAGEVKKRIAPQEDLVINLDNPTPPQITEEVKVQNSGYRKETMLHALGYQLTDLTRHQREEVLLKVAIPYLKLPKVMRTILDLIYSKKKRIANHRNALIEWNYDIDTLISKFGLNAKEISEDTIQYVLSVKRLMEKNFIPLTISSQQAEELSNK